MNEEEPFNVKRTRQPLGNIIYGAWHWSICRKRGILPQVALRHETLQCGSIIEVHKPDRAILSLNS
jgi:hypothetical protein